MSPSWRNTRKGLATGGGSPMADIDDTSQTIQGMIPGQFVEMENPFDDNSALQTSKLHTEKSANLPYAKI